MAGRLREPDVPGDHCGVDLAGEVVLDLFRHLHGQIGAPVEHGQQHANLTFTSKITALEKRLAPYIELTAFRILQEAMSNIIRHSEATEVSVTLAIMHEWIFLCIKDNGKGFRQQTEYDLPRGDVTGIGLLGMAERASSVEGYLEVTSAPNQGCTVDVFLPLLFVTEKRIQGERHG